MEVAWSMVANHGGGYSYRLCPATQAPTEACFQAHALRFAGDRQTIVNVSGDVGPSSPFRVSLCAARALNATGQSRVTLSLR